MNIQLHRDRVTKKPYLQIKLPVILEDETDTIEGEIMSDFLIEGERNGIELNIVQQGQERESFGIITIKEVDK